MSNMQNLDAALAEQERQQLVYDRAMAKLAHKDDLREGEGLTLMFAWDAFGDEVRPGGSLALAGKLAAMFCIGFGFFAPILMFITYGP